MATPLNNPAWVEWMTGLMGAAPRQTCAVALPPDRFYCLLDGLPLHLIPRQSRQALRARGDQNDALFLNPECVVYVPGKLPDELQAGTGLVAGFALDGYVAWVRSAASGNLLPFWLGPELANIVTGLRPNEPVLDSVPAHLRAILNAADILICENEMQQRSGQREERIRQASAGFRTKGYAPISDLIHPFHIAALRRYYRHRIRNGEIRLGDGQSPRRYVAYNDPVARFFHNDITSTLSALAGEPLKPSYVYLASYMSGAELKKHTDREQCEFSITLCLDFAPEPELATPWPIRLETARGTVTVYQALGDGLAYRGTRLPHYRERLGEGQTSTSIFFHYVSEDFAGSLD